MKLWKGRFTKTATSSANEFNASIPFDQRMYAQDIAGSCAHAAMLAKQGIIEKDEADQIISALKDIKADIEAGKIEFTIEQEDIHMNIESILTERIGDVGKKLHTARSRNDQVAVDFRMYLKEEINEIQSLLKNLKSALYEIADKNQETIMPGYTHLQRAQPVTLAHYMLAYYNMFNRDEQRFEDCLGRTDMLPLGCGALAGTTYNTDRDFLAQELGFAGICPNSLDAVSDRSIRICILVHTIEVIKIAFAAVGTGPVIGMERHGTFRVTEDIADRQGIAAVRLAPECILTDAVQDCFAVVHGQRRELRAVIKGVLANGRRERQLGGGQVDTALEPVRQIWDGQRFHVLKPDLGDLIADSRPRLIVRTGKDRRFAAAGDG